jgi:hypothetical protein
MQSPCLSAHLVQHVTTSGEVIVLMVGDVVSVLVVVVVVVSVVGEVLIVVTVVSVDVVVVVVRLMLVRLVDVSSSCSEVVPVDDVSTGSVST